jgi:hypothetical protein
MKKIILVFALLVPIGIFIFLKFFGKNEFSIPVYYESEPIPPPQGCIQKYELPYKVSAKAINQLGWSREVVLFCFDTTKRANLNISRLAEEFDKGQFQVIFLQPSSGFDSLSTCHFLIQPPWTSVLVDSQRRIRGYYQPGSREEIDRLSVEIKILLKKY